MMGDDLLGAVYGRVSTKEQNIEQQKDTCVNYCRGQGWRYRSYLDVGESRFVEDRPEWQRCLGDVEKGKYDFLIVQRYDRITADLGYAVKFLDWLEKIYRDNPGFRLYSVYDGVFRFKEGVGFHPDDVFIFKLKCLLAEKEVKDMKWRQRIGIERAKKEDKYKGGKPGRSWADD